MPEKIAELILPLAVKSNYQYLLNEEMAENASIGMRVLVNFGKSKIYTGIIKNIFPKTLVEGGPKLKYIEDILDDFPIFSRDHIKLHEWIAFYYMCTEGEVLKAALPIGLKPESALRVHMVEGLSWDQLPLKDHEFVLLEALEIQPILNYQEITKIWSVSNPMPRLKVMVARGLINIFQQVEEKYKAKYKSYLRLADAYTPETQQKIALESLGRAPSQENLFLTILSSFYKDQWVPKTETLKSLGIGGQVAKELLKKGFITEEEVQVDRLELYGYDRQPKEIILTAAQERVLREIREAIASSILKPVLLHGITGSGKTHIYLELMKEALAQGKQVLYLLPEITLTKQIIERVKAELGDKVGVYHSKFNDHERVEIWQKVLKREYEVVIGVRSSIFIPFQDLGLIVVDEEHDSSFKQHEPAPRYNARDVAVFYGHLLKVPVILGSATPSYESYTNALTDKYHLVSLQERATKVQLPSLEIVDMKIQYKKRISNGIFSKPLFDEINNRLEAKEQIILFQNRRGYAPYLICQHCGEIPQCINCDISLTYHKERKHLRCHYCGYTDSQTHICHHCGHPALRHGGIGTEQIEEQVKMTFPNANVGRMDLDTTRTKMGYHNLISRFENKELDILVGTQMVSKGLDFENVTLVGVISADHILSFPDFRNFEKAYQLLTQVSGRAGRNLKRGMVIIQTLLPDNLVLSSLEKPFETLYKLEMHQRKQLKYPPFSRIIRIETRHKEANKIQSQSIQLKKLISKYLRLPILGPEFALVPRIRNQYRMQMIIKLGKQQDPSHIRDSIQRAIYRFNEERTESPVRIILDVDPA